ncbi:hypothetical protein [Streptomyces mirabilis]|uniref:hypothetical protein n=1 Tax=Streptomyces mirabilis TaxID=68239 RepID=UPI002259AF11|nr:hypothetical protein [Streptomyces mirabilis]MCX4423626.1 hypothetical protein [Streptomyces mirabilis]
MSDRQHEAIVRRTEQADIEGLVACGSAVFAEDAGTRDLQKPRGRQPAHTATLKYGPLR